MERRQALAEGTNRAQTPTHRRPHSSLLMAHARPVRTPDPNHSIIAGALAAGILGLGLAPPAAQALVKGNAPPSDLRKAKAGGKPKTANMEDAMDLGRQKARCACLSGCHSRYRFTISINRFPGRWYIMLLTLAAPRRKLLYHRSRSSSTRATRTAALRRPRTVRHARPSSSELSHHRNQPHRHGNIQQATGTVTFWWAAAESCRTVSRAPSATGPCGWGSGVATGCRGRRRRSSASATGRTTTRTAT